MPAKTSNGNKKAWTTYHSDYTEDGLTPTGGASEEADRLLALTEATKVTFRRTGERRQPRAGEMYASESGYVNVASWNIDQDYDIVEVIRAS